MGAERIAAFAVFALVSSITPGPNNVMLTSTGAGVGFRRGLPHVAGVALGFGLMVFLVAAGAGAMLTEDPVAMRGLPRPRHHGAALARMEDGRGGSCRKGGRRAPIGFLEAAAFQCVNPKAWLYCAGVIGGFLESHGPAPTIQPATLSLVTVAIGVPCMLVWLGLGTAMQRLVRTDRALRNFNGGMGLCSQPQPSRWCSRVVFPFTGFAW